LRSPFTRLTFLRNFASSMQKLRSVLRCGISCRGFSCAQHTRRNRLYELSNRVERDERRE
jgi:hypothetical protein